MQTKQLCFLIHICNKGEVGAMIPVPQVKYFTDHLKAVLLLWIVMLFLPCVCDAFVLVCLLMPRGHLLGKG